jgi:hypothetical protein
MQWRPDAVSSHLPTPSPTPGRRGVCRIWARKKAPLHEVGEGKKRKTYPDEIVIQALLCQCYEFTLTA